MKNKYHSKIGLLLFTFCVSSLFAFERWDERAALGAFCQCTCQVEISNEMLCVSDPVNVPCNTTFEVPVSSATQDCTKLHNYCDGYKKSGADSTGVLVCKIKNPIIK